MISFKYNVKRNIEQPQRFIPNACVQDQQTSTLLFIYKIDLDQVQQVDWISMSISMRLWREVSKKKITLAFYNSLCFCKNTLAVPYKRMNSAIDFRWWFFLLHEIGCVWVCVRCMYERHSMHICMDMGFNTEYERCVRTNASYDLCVLTSEYELSVPRITTSSGDVWLATQKPTPFGRFLVSWNVMTADSGRANMRCPALNTMSLKYRRIFRSGMSPISENEMIARLAYIAIYMRR